MSAIENECCGDGPNDHIGKPSHRWRLWLIGYIERYAQNRRSNKDQETSQDRWVRRTTSATIWTAVATLILAAVSLWGTSISQDTLTEIKKSGKQTDATIKALQSQATSMQGQLTALEESNRINNLALTAVQRAMISIHTPTMITTPDPLHAGQTFHQLTFGWANDGNTPPRNLIRKYRFFPSDKELSNPWGFNNSNVLPKDTIAPHTADGEGSYIMSSEDSSKYAKKLAYFYAIAEATYNDVLNPKVIHVTQYCATYHGFGAILGNNLTQTDWQSCVRHNCIDEECDEK